MLYSCTNMATLGIKELLTLGNLLHLCTLSYLFSAFGSRRRGHFIPAGTWVHVGVIDHAEVENNDKPLLLTKLQLSGI